MKLEQPQVDFERVFKSESILHLIEYTLLHSQKANEGNKGVILEFDLSKISPEDLRLLLPADLELTPELLAAKVLKIYSPGQMANEAKMQERAYELINDQAEEGLDYAQVPRVYYSGEINLANDELDNYLESSSVNTVGGKAGIMLMDYIQGEDLATYVYKYLIRHDSRFIDLRQRLDEDGESFDFPSLERRVGGTLGYQDPSSLSNPAEQLRVEAANSERLFSALKKNGFTLDGQVIIQLQNTIKLLHDNNIWHNDLHRRNVMLSFDDAGQIKETYIIDFGSSADTQDKDGLAYDFDIVDSYRKFVEGERQPADDIWLNDINRLRQRLEKNQNSVKYKEWQDLQAKIKDIIAIGGSSMLVNLDHEICSKTYNLMSSEDWLKLAASLILDIAKDNPDLAKKLTQLNMTKPVNAYTSNFWANLLKQL